MTSSRPSSAPTTAPTVAEYATGLQKTRVHPTEGGRFLWWQGPGERNPRPAAAPLAHLVPHCETDCGVARLAVPESADDDGLVYRVDGSHSVAAWLRDPRPQAWRLSADALGAAARALRLLHGVPVPRGDPADEAQTVPGTPPALERLRTWADGQDPACSDGSAGHAVRRLREHTLKAWGRARWERLRAWCADSASGDGADSAVLVHGFASLGALVPPLRHGPVALLTGEDLGLGRPELDLGWLLGDVAELGWAVPGFGGPDGFADDELPRVVLGAYGQDVNVPAVGRAAVLRVVAHMRDFAAFRDWNDELPAYIAFTAELIDEEGFRAVARGAS